MSLPPAVNTDISLQLNYLPKLIYSMQQNGINVIQNLLIHNLSAKEDIDIEITTEPAFTPSSHKHFPRLEADCTIEVEDIWLAWDAQHLADLQEAQTINIKVCIRQAKTCLLDQKFPLEILPPDTWIGSAILPELLCSFVTPNAENIPLILQRAASLLAEWSGSPDFTAYLSCNEDKVRQQMAAIYQAIAEWGIVYSMPPADFARMGQRVRLVDKIYDQRLATCLDMALLYASCLEAIGLNPLLVLIKGHAFVGSWLIEDMLSDPVCDDVTTLRKRIAKGIHEMSFIEATSMNAARNHSFEESTRIAHELFLDEAAFEYAIDVKRCRLSGIKPLASAQKGLAVGSAFENQAVDSSPESLSPRRVMDVPDRELLNKQSVWERKLLDLSLRNNLLNVRKTRSLIPILSAKLPLLEDSLAEGKDFLLLPRPSDFAIGSEDISEFRPITENELLAELIHEEMRHGRLHCYDTEAEAQKNFTHLYRSARLAMEENGVNTLYLALGLLRWYESPVSERARFAPILLLPVEMKRRRGVSGAYSLRSSEAEIIVNITLLEMLKQDFSIDLSVITQLPRDKHGVDIALVFNTLRNMLKDQPRWDVEEQALLGTFSFSKFIMWNDIHHNADILRRHPLVESLIQSQIQWAASEEADLALDTQFRPAELLLPVPSDSYQMEAVYRAAVQGQSFVLHGPPGSGKSQTITNMIANALYRGQSVLFVAEKMAALSVVHQRLSQIGLGPFCLELHSNKATKTSVIAQLQEAADYKLGHTAADFQGESDRLYQLRQELRQHVDALHEQLPLGLSLYETLYAQEQLPEAAASRYTPATGQSLLMSKADWRDALDACEKLQSIAQTCGCPASHVLRKIGKKEYTPDLKEGADKSFLQLKKSCESLLEAMDKARQSLGMPEFKPTMAHAEAWSECLSILLGQQPITPALLAYENPQELLSHAKELAHLGEEAEKKVALVTDKLQGSVLNLDAKALQQQWQAAAGQWFLPQFLTRRRVMKALRAHLGSLQNLEKEDVADCLKSVIGAQKAQAALAVHHSFQQEYFAALQTDWSGIVATAQAVHQLNTLLLKLLGDIKAVKALKTQIAQDFAMGKEAFIQTHAEQLSPVIAAFTPVQQERSALADLLEMEPLSQDLPECVSELESLEQNLDKLRDWCLWNFEAARCAQIGDGHLALFLDFVKRGIFEPSHLVDEYKRGIYEDICKSQMKRHPNFAQFNGLVYEERLAKYRELALLNQELSRLELCAKLGAQLPNISREAAGNSELGVLQRNLRSKGWGMSIRQLFEQLPHLLRRIKPCMLMSPMSAAQYIDVTQEAFDLVIFDEASQMPTCDAVGAIARGKSVVVVGDPKQMPPTSFFSSNKVDEEHLELEDLESILEDCLGLGMLSHHLRWHYRSKHESLIAFSNAQYYENSLLTFPSPDDLCSKLSLIPVSGYYDKGKSRCNKAEAEAIVVAALRHLADPQSQQLSLGIISFSQVQQSLIEDMLTHALAKAENAQLEERAFGVEEPIFIKNLENVQGDERDVIFFSVGYGPNEEGYVSHNFGPLNREGGERRLNVAVSRARYEMKVFSTLMPDQIDLRRTKSQGVAGLRAFLEFAQKGKIALQQKSGSAYAPQPSIIDTIAGVLKERGYDIQCHVGSSAYRVDLAVVHPDKPEEYLAAIICDGASYQAAPTLRDREITRVGVLRALGWNVLRLWTLDWWMEREKVLARLCESLEELKTHQQQQEEIVLDIAPVLVEAPRRAGRQYPYQQVEIAPIDCGEQDPLQSAFAPQMYAQISQILGVEAPMHPEYMMRRLMQIWGIKVLSKRVENYFNLLFDAMKLHQIGGDESPTLWNSAEQAANYGIYRTGGPREAKYIPPVEIALAAYDLLEQQLAMPREDLQAQIIELFELGRKTKSLRSLIDQGIQVALNRGYIIEEGNRCKLA